MSCTDKQTKLEQVVTRRNLLKAAFASGVVTVANVASAAGGSPGMQVPLGSGALFLDEEPVEEEEVAAVLTDMPAVDDVLVYMRGDKQGEPVVVADLPDLEGFRDIPAIWVNPRPDGGETKIGHANTLILARLSTEDIADDMAEFISQSGIVAFSAVCTHFSCFVDRITEEGYISCACHGSIYDPTQAAKPIDGPAPFALSMIPVREDDDGQLLIAGEFNAPLPL